MSTKIVTALVHAHSSSNRGTRTITIDLDKITSIKQERVRGQDVYHVRFSDAPSEYLLEDPREDYILLRETLDVFEAFIATFDRPLRPVELRAAFAAKKYWEGYYSYYDGLDEEGFTEQDINKKIKINVLATWETFLEEAQLVELEILQKTQT